MLVKDQLKVRMDQLEMPVNELAKRIGVSNQTIRHWLNGRNYPTKKHIPDLEKALSMRLDFSEGVGAHRPTADATLEKADIEIFLLISRMPPEMKSPLLNLAKAMAAAMERVEVLSQQREASNGRAPMTVKHSPARRPASR
jgi:transcriptional regulator with XRE-family HTH domain